ncbi:MAG TPA: FG-GAP-like repeat-containing protein [Kofleriaceae bacterium]|nr:FG-GAP-like repeat-containing protein [Kofleriaceae bacterium]
MGRWSWALPLLALAGCDIYGDDDSYDPPPPDEEQPVAHDDSITVAEDAYDISLTETLTANDRNPGQINQVTPAAHGTATADGWGGVHYVPFTGYHGPDSFTYSYCCGATGSTATVTVDVVSDGIPYEEGVQVDTGYYSSGLAAGDLDGDGRADLAVLDSSTNSVAILVNRSAGALDFTFDSYHFEAGRGPTAVAIADVDGDGDSDVVTAASTDGVLVVLPNISTGGAVAFDQPLYLNVVAPTDVVVTDLNGDGRPDLAALQETYWLADDELVVFLNQSAEPGTLAFSAAWSFAGPATPTALAVGDLDADGRPDLVVTGQGDSTMSVYVNATGIGDQVPVFQARVDRPTGNGPSDIAIADLDGDGRQEITLAHSYDPAAWVFRNTTPDAGAPTFGAAQVLPGTISAVAEALDVDADGHRDLLFGRSGNGSIGVLFNHTETGGALRLDAGAIGTLGLQNQGQVYAVNSLGDPTGMALVDLDGVGRPELVMTASSWGTYGTLILFER